MVTRGNRSRSNPLGLRRRDLAASVRVSKVFASVIEDLILRPKRVSVSNAAQQFAASTSGHGD
jgi:hypothetical protein